MKRNYLIRNAIDDICLVSKNNAYAIQAKTLVNLPIPVPEVGWVFTFRPEKMKYFDLHIP